MSLSKRLGLPGVVTFSVSYDITELQIVPSKEDFSRINRQFYVDLQSRSALQDKRVPIIARLPGDNTYVELYPDDNVQSNTLEMPFRTVNSSGINNPPSTEPVLIAKPDHARSLMKQFSYRELEE